MCGLQSSHPPSSRTIARVFAFLRGKQYSPVIREVKKTDALFHIADGAFRIMWRLLSEIFRRIRKLRRRLLGVRFVQIPPEFRKICDLYPEQVIGTMLAGGLSPSTADLQSLFQSETTKAYARDWLTERAEIRDADERWVQGREFVLEVVVIFLEIVVIGLIGWEIYIGISGERQQAKDFRDEQCILKQLEDNAGKTTDALGKLNTKIQLEIDMYYKPSVHLKYFQRPGRNVVEIYNQGRTNITVFGARSDLHLNLPDVSPLRKELTISYNSPNDLESDQAQRVIQDVIRSDTLRLLGVYFRTEDGKEWELQVRVERCASDEGKCVTFEDQKIVPGEWEREVEKDRRRKRGQ